LFHLFLEENPNAKNAKGKIKKSSFLSLRPPQVKKPNKFTDMCELCNEGKRAQNQLQSFVKMLSVE
jgi:hypothetical protein